MTDRDTRQYSIVLCVLFLVCAIVFSAFPGIDLWASGFFWTAEDGFWINNVDWVRSLRSALKKLMVLVFMASALAWVLTLSWRPVLGIPARAWAYSTLLFVIGPGLLVNVLLKEHWGRARPAKILEFGGEKHFTAALDIADQCAQNCSFVSGEGAGATALLLATIVLARAGPHHRIGQVFVRIVWPLAVIAICLRVMMGRHFLSDTLFSILIVVGVGVILARLLKIGATSDP